MINQQVSIRLLCVDLPAAPEGYDAVEISLLDKSRQLVFGVPTPDGGLRFDIELRVNQFTDGSPSFTGTLAIGPRQARFLYLSQMGLRAGEWHIIKRIKVQLGVITWAQVEAVLGDEQQVLQGIVSGQEITTPSLLGDGWSVQARD